MNRFASSGPVAVTLVEKDGAAVYEAVLNKQLVAQIRLEDWENPELDFYSREAAQMIADSVKDVYASVIETEADIDTEGDMIKHPDGTTTDVPEGKEKGHPEDDEKHDDPFENDATKTIIIHLNELIQKAETAHRDGHLELEAAFLDEAENFAARIAVIQADLAKTAASQLLEAAHIKLVEGLDCTAEISQAEILIKQFAINGITFEQHEARLEKEAHPSLWARLTKRIFNG